LEIKNEFLQLKQNAKQESMLRRPALRDFKRLEERPFRPSFPLRKNTPPPPTNHPASNRAHQERESDFS